MNIAKKASASLNEMFDHDVNRTTSVFINGKMCKMQDTDDIDFLRLFLPFLSFVKHAEVDNLIDDLEEKKIACDMTLRDFLAQAGVSERGMAYADAVYAQTSALSLDEMGVLATQREVAQCLVRLTSWH